MIFYTEDIYILHLLPTVYVTSNFIQSKDVVFFSFYTLFYQLKPHLEITRYIYVDIFGPFSFQPQFRTKGKQSYLRNIKDYFSVKMPVAWAQSGGCIIKQKTDFIYKEKKNWLQTKMLKA